MKFHHALTCIALFALICLSCKKDKTPEPPLRFSSAEVNLLSGEDSTITIEGIAPPYTATAGNAQIVQVKVENDQLLLTADLAEKTEITVKDNAGNTAIIKANVHSMDGDWGRALGPDETYGKAIVEAGDAAFAATLEKELLEVSATSIRGYQFRESEKKFREVYGGNSFKEGTYTYRKLALTLTFEGNEEICRVTPFNFRFVMLERDLTAIYQALHPDKNIQKVVVTFYLRFRPMYG
ncbi:hypothetical protein [Chitinophaga alhagiae]|uniref:hypothetical protein n=1 Tax=Chitinophaga alhagiae TaxID=2203219 RepID=UPI0013007ADB|nr:hypothetical protein [Chitinophaga alhagiae]